MAHFGLAAAEVAQGHYVAAIPPLCELTRLEPKFAFGWMALSDCALRSGRKQESAEYARRATAVAPSSSDAWVLPIKKRECIARQ
jgi:predicted Zn-dependent protease